MRIIYLLLLGLLWLSQPLISMEAHPKQKYNVLFITFDAGETYALLPVMERLQDLKASFAVLALGTSRGILKNSPLDQKHVLTLDESFGLKDLVDHSWPRNEVGETDALNKALRRVEAQTAITGSVSLIQLKIIQHFQRSGSYTIAFYDSFCPSHLGPHREYGREIFQTVDSIFVPSQSVKDSFGRTNVRVVGQPSLTTWVHSAKEFHKSEIRRELKLGENTPTFIFIGGYEPDYQRALRSFLGIFSTHKEARLLISPHPKVDGSWEKALIKEMNLTNTSVLDSSILSTKEAVIASDGVICHHSTVGGQALFVPRPVAYYILRDEDPDFEIPVNVGNVYLCTNKKECDFFLEKAPSLKQESTHSLFEEAGIPENATEIITELLLQNRQPH